MKLSRKILGTFAAVLMTACGVEVDQEQIHRVDEGSVQDISLQEDYDGEGHSFDLAGSVFQSIGSGSSLSTATNSLSCSNSAGDGIRNINNINFSNKELTVKLNVNVNNTSHSQWFGLESGTKNIYLKLFRWGNIYQIKAGKNNADLVHTNYGSNNIKYLKIKHEAGPQRVTMATSSNGSSWTNFAYINFSNTSSMKIVYRCGGNSASTITDLKLNGARQDLSLGSSGGGGSGGGGSGGGGSGGGGSSSNVLQAENGTRSGGRVRSGHSGYTGSGYMDFTSRTDKVTWSGLNLAAGQYEVTVRYGNGASRKVALRINGTVKTNFPLRVQGTRNWGVWKTEKKTITVNSTITSIAIDANNLSSGPNLDKIEIHPVGGSGGGGSGGGGSGGGSGKIADHPEYSYFLKAHNFFQAQKVRSTANSSVYTLRTYNAGGGWSKAADVYDNGIAAITYTVTGRAADAGQILNSYLKIYQGLEDWGNSVGQEKRLLTQRVYTDSLLPNNEIEDPAEDLGNNSYMMLAFCKYFNQFRGDGASMAELLPYYDRAYKILDYIWRKRLKTNGTDRFIGRDTNGYASAEHHVNLYAFGKCMQQYIPSGRGYSASRINQFTNVANLFVKAMWDNGVGAYRIGTVDNENSDAINYGDGFPADMSSWRYMSGAGFRSAGDDTRSLNWLTSTSGVWVRQNTFGISNFAGVKFTSNPGANGQQTENTGAALAALKKHGGFATKANQIESSLKSLFNQRGNGGLPSHSRNPDGSCCNTGLGWSYFNVPHVASTAYAILGILGESPYKTTKSGFTRTGAVVKP